MDAHPPSQSHHHQQHQQLQEVASFGNNSQEPPGRTQSFESADKLRSQSVELNDQHIKNNTDGNPVLHASLQDSHIQNKLRHAEGKIGSLMQELEDLRFFHEIDMEPATPIS